MEYGSLFPILLSARVACVALLIVGPIGIGLAWFQARRHYRFRSVVDAFILLPLIPPPSVVGFFLVVLLGRRGPEGSAIPGDEAITWFRERARGLKVEHEGPKPLLLGRHLLEMGLEEGPRVGWISGEVYEMQLEGAVTSLDEAREAARRLMAEPLP